METERTLARNTVAILHVGISLWLLGLALATVLGLGSAYVHAGQRCLFAPMGWSSRTLRWALRVVASTVTRLVRGLLTWLLHRLSEW